MPKPFQGIANVDVRDSTPDWEPYIPPRAPEGQMRTQLANFTRCGDGLCVGRDSGDAVSKEYAPAGPFKGGTIVQVEVSTGDDQYVDLEKQAVAMLARE